MPEPGPAPGGLCFYSYHCAKSRIMCEFAAAIVRGLSVILMVDFTDDENAEFEAELARQIAQVPPELYEAMKPLLLLTTLANHLLLGFPDDPVPQALKQELNYDMEDVNAVAAAQDTPGLARLMALQTLSLFDVLLVGQLVFESALAEPLRGYLSRYGQLGESFDALRDYLFSYGETMLTSTGQYLTRNNAEMGEELRLRRLHTESIFARLDDTLRPYYPAGQSPDDDRAHALDAADEAEDQEEAAVHIRFNEVQRVTLGLALRLPQLLADLGDTPFAQALAQVLRLRPKALLRLNERLQKSPDGEPFEMTWSELLRLYQAAHVCALSAVANVTNAGSLEDFFGQNEISPAETPEERTESAFRTRELIMQVMGGFIEVIDQNHPDDEDVAATRDEIAQLAELLA